MCATKFFVILSLVLFATSVTAQNDARLQCLQSAVMTEKARNLEKCYADTFNTVLLKNSSLSCKSLSDFNNTYTMFYKDVLKTCFNQTNTVLTETEKTFLNMVKALLDFDKLNETRCLFDLLPKIQECRKQNLTDRNITETWLRRTTVHFTVYSCDKINDNRNCTIDIIKENCKSKYNTEVTNLISSLYDIALKQCNTTAPTTKGSSSSPYISPFSHLFLFITAFALITNS